MTEPQILASVSNEFLADSPMRIMPMGCLILRSNNCVGSVPVDGPISLQPFNQRVQNRRLFDAGQLRRTEYLAWRLPDHLTSQPHFLRPCAKGIITTDPQFVVVPGSQHATSQARDAFAGSTFLVCQFGTLPKSRVEHESWHQQRVREATNVGWPDRFPGRDAYLRVLSRAEYCVSCCPSTRHGRICASE